MFGSAVAVVGGGLFLWLALLYPLWPVSGLGWLAAIGSGLMVIAWAALCVLAIHWLNKQQRHVIFFKVVGVVVALSLGVGVFLGASTARDFMTKNFSYAN